MNATVPRARANLGWQAQCQPKAGASLRHPRPRHRPRNPPLSLTLSPLRGAREESDPTLDLDPDLDRSTDR